MVGRSSWRVVGGGLVRQVGGRVAGWSGRWLVGQVVGGLLGGCVMAGLIGYIEHLNLVGVHVEVGVGVKLGKCVVPSEHPYSNW